MESEIQWGNVEDQRKALQKKFEKVRAAVAPGKQKLVDRGSDLEEHLRQASESKKTALRAVGQRFEKHIQLQMEVCDLRDKLSAADKRVRVGGATGCCEGRWSFKCWWRRG